MIVKEINLQKQSLQEELSELTIGDSVILIKSSISDKEINGNEFQINMKCAQLHSDAEIDYGFEDYKVKITFIERKDKGLKFGVCHRINQNFTPISKVKPTLSIKKGDKIQTIEGFIGIITKYPSNKEIEIINLDTQEKKVVSKEEILKVV